MSDVFISYARSTVETAHAVAEALRALGYDVWRDDQLPAHRAYTDVIEERLHAAKAVVVVWSAEAAKSQWVRAEADVARQAGSLVQLRVDDTPLPLPFNQVQCVDLGAWPADTNAPGWRKVLDSVRELVSGEGAPASASAPVQPATSAAPRPVGPSICVLPFANMSGDAEQEYFSDGVCEDIITDLSKVSALSVVSRNTAFQFKGRHVDVRQVAAQLGVTYVLEGSVRRSGARVRITAQLIEGVSDTHVWAERYDRDLTDIFDLQDEISQSIVAALRLRLLPDEQTAIRRRATDSTDAYTLYLMARRLWVSGNTDAAGHDSIVSLCRRAVEIDPDYADAWALMALTQTSLHFRFGRAEDGLATAERALALDPALAEAHAVRARYLVEQKRIEEADAELATSIRLDPDSYEVIHNAAHLSFRLQRIGDAILYFEKAATLMETSYGAASMLISCYAAAGDTAGMQRAARMTLARAEAALEQDQSNGQALGFGANALAALGDLPRTRDWVARALRIDPRNRTMRYNLACALSLNLGDVEGAIDLLEPFLATASAGEVHHVSIDPDLDPLRTSPRFTALIAEAEARTG